MTATGVADRHGAPTPTALPRAGGAREARTPRPVTAPPASNRWWSPDHFRSTTRMERFELSRSGFGDRPTQPALTRSDDVAGGSRTPTPERTRPSTWRGCHYATATKCAGGDSNPHVRRHRFLRPTRLPRLRHLREVRGEGVEPPMSRRIRVYSPVLPTDSTPSPRRWSRPESNRHARRHPLLRRARLPVPPRDQEEPAMSTSSSSETTKPPGPVRCRGLRRSSDLGSYAYDTPSGTAKSSDDKLEYQLAERTVVDERTIMERG